MIDSTVWNTRVVQPYCQRKKRGEARRHRAESKRGREREQKEDRYRMLPSKTDDSDLSEGSRLRFETLAMGR
ncbi:hypothetical protein ALC62_03719 [Cyphomyrmex costatus]|uniref:Uncharacterized protein n=1 Tax=Cyphomyrmex costatus TaxID=456900 RepID=A0A195CZ81_9HYME|nr:hypothetical protein ALC62_03719 [Cyphomyrmex costatus]